jgi:hypothetical protein
MSSALPKDCLDTGRALLVVNNVNFSDWTLGLDRILKLLTAY